MRTALFGSCRFLDFDFARDYLQLRGDALERLPRMRLAVEIRGDDLVDERAARITGRNDPARRPEKIRRRTCPRSRMRAVSSRELLAVGKLDAKLLQFLVIERFARLVEH